MQATENNGKTASRQARRAIDGALSKDRGRLLALWSKWNAKPADPALREGLKDFVLATEAEIADAVRLVMRTTHSLVEGAGATPFAGLRLLRDRLAGRKVAVVLSGSNIDAETLRRVVNGEI